MNTTHAKTNEWLKFGNIVTLKLNDAFGSTMEVRIVKVQKGGNVLVFDGEHMRQVAACNLMERK